tara:strand:- start:143 stop:712 length:570 start_codon:yes stop_codon:yes gene_type:complete
MISADIPLDSVSHNSGSLQYGTITHYEFLMDDAEMLERNFRLYEASGSFYSPKSSWNVSGGAVYSYPALTKLASFLHEITSIFSMTKEELASVCHVGSRATLYNWLQGDVTPRKETQFRVYELLKVARAYKFNCGKLTHEQLCTPAFKGKSILELLKEDTLNQEAIIFAGNTIAFNSSDSWALLSDPFA